MKRQVLILAVAALASGLVGCEYPDGDPNYTGTGALVGGGAGAVTGAAIGGERNGGEGALIGAAVGAVAGGLIGNTMDRQQQERLRQQAPQTYARVDQGQPLSVNDVKRSPKRESATTSSSARFAIRTRSITSTRQISLICATPA